MAGLYIHIPYCRKACHYCDFHFSTNLSTKGALMHALKKEIRLKADDFTHEINTIYFGGGTPSLMNQAELQDVFILIHEIFNTSKEAEITIEINPEDLSSRYLRSLRELGVNRLSIGIQTFNDDLLKFINRAHLSAESISGVRMAQEEGFQNISVDLIYGIPGSSETTWCKDLEQICSMNIQHASIYGMTIEPNTVFGNRLSKKTLQEKDEDSQVQLFLDSHQKMSNSGFEHYEVSNYCLPGYRSKHNSSYWNQEPYIGFGPGAHSFTVNNRFFNIKNNIKYIEALNKNIIPEEKEVLSKTQKNQRVPNG